MVEGEKQRRGHALKSSKNDCGNYKGLKRPCLDVVGPFEELMDDASLEDNGGKQADVLTKDQLCVPDTPLLHNLGSHPSIYARLGLEPPGQNRAMRGAWMRAVRLCSKTADESYRNFMSTTCFHDFLLIEPMKVHHPYLHALAERWFSETNTLHLPFSEIGPTPADWIMITGVPFRGTPVPYHPIKRSEVMKLLNVGPEAFNRNHLRLNSLVSDVDFSVPPVATDKTWMCRRLFLYMIGSCFFCNNRSVIDLRLVRSVEDLDSINAYDWGSLTFATFLTGMRRKVTSNSGAFTAFWPFLLFWAFEYLNIFRPTVAGGDFFPRACRWHPSKVIEKPKLQDFISARCLLDYIEESQVTWEPYKGSSIYESELFRPIRKLSQQRVPFQGLDDWEYFLGERCLRQFGYSVRVPKPPPTFRFGDRDHPPIDQMGVGCSATVFVESVDMDYEAWFQHQSVGQLIMPDRYLMGFGLGGKLLKDCLESQCPGTKLVHVSEIEKLKMAATRAELERDEAIAARDQARTDAENAKLELVKLQRELNLLRPDRHHSPFG